MSYDTFYFALFLAATWAAFAVLPWRGYVLLLASIGFFAVAGLRDSLLATAVILVNYAFQFAIMRDRRWLYGALVLNIGCLAYFKYRVFLETAAGLDVFAQHLVIPLGISFYIFQLTAFLIDLSRGRAILFAAALCAFQVVLRPARGRSDHALAAVRAADPSPVRRHPAAAPIARDRAWALPCRFDQEGRLRRRARAVRRNDLPQRPGERRGGVAGHLPVQLASVLRFFRLFRYCAGLRLPVR